MLARTGFWCLVGTEGNSPDPPKTTPLHDPAIPPLRPSIIPFYSPLSPLSRVSPLFPMNPPSLHFSTSPSGRESPPLSIPTLSSSSHLLLPLRYHALPISPLLQRLQPLPCPSLVAAPREGPLRTLHKRGEDTVRPQLTGQLHPSLCTLPGPFR